MITELEQKIGTQLDLGDYPKNYAYRLIHGYGQTLKWRVKIPELVQPPHSVLLAIESYRRSIELVHEMKPSIGDIESSIAGSTVSASMQLSKLRNDKSDDELVNEVMALDPLIRFTREFESLIPSVERVVDKSSSEVLDFFDSNTNLLNESFHGEVNRGEEKSEFVGSRINGTYIGLSTFSSAGVILSQFCGTTRHFPDVDILESIPLSISPFGVQFETAPYLARVFAGPARILKFSRSSRRVNQSRLMYKGINLAQFDESNAEIRDLGRIKGIDRSFIEVKRGGIEDVSKLLAEEYVRLLRFL